MIDALTTKNWQQRDLFIIVYDLYRRFIKLWQTNKNFIKTHNFRYAGRGMRVIDLEIK